MGKNGLLIIIAGVSGSGKNTMIHLLTERNPQFKEVISYTSRAMREEEMPDINYHYISLEQFEEGVKNNYFLEYAKNHKLYYYGTNRDEILSHIERGETVLKEMSVQGVQQMALNHKDILSNSFSIFLDLPDTKMIPRIVSRAHISEQELAGRLESAHIEREIAPTCCNKMISADGSIEEVYKRVFDAIQDFIKSSA